MSALRFFLLAGLYLCVLATPARATIIFFEEFISGVQNPSLIFESTSAAYSVGYDGDFALFTRTGTTEEGRVQLRTSFSLTGDFTAVTVAHRADLGTNGALGLVAWYSLVDPFAFADIFFEGNNSINTALQGFGPGAIASTSVADAWFRIRRTGDTIYLEYYEGVSATYPANLFMTLNTLTAPALADPVSIGVFLFHPAGAGDASGHFDVLAIDQVPEPGTMFLLGIGLLALGIRRR